MKRILIKAKNISIKYEFIKNRTFKEYIYNLFKIKKIGHKEKLLALKNVSFEIYTGDIIGIIGRNGAGKSTLLKTIANIYSTDSGEIENYSSKTSLLALGIGFQNDLSGKDNIFISGLLLGMTMEELKRKYLNIVEFAELEQFIEMPLKSYSAGMRSKLAFSIASHIEPELLLIDEVFSVGDINFKKKSNDKILELIHGDRTIVMVSHSLGIIKKLCNRVIWLEKGEVKMIGETSEVIKKYEEFNN